MESAANTRMRNHFLCLMMEVQKLNKAIIKKNDKIERFKNHSRIQYECISRQNIQIAKLKKEMEVAAA